MIYFELKISLTPYVSHSIKFSSEQKLFIFDVFYDIVYCGQEISITQFFYFFFKLICLLSYGFVNKINMLLI